MSRLLRTIFTITLVLTFMLSCSSRPHPTISVNDLLEIAEAEKIELDEKCEGIGEEECLMRRTLVAHVDYIYTQKQKP